MRMKTPRHDWYLKEWMKTLGKRQKDFVKDLDWNPARISLMMRCKQQYTRDAVNEVADYLNLEPFELLMDPERAMALRRLKATAQQIASVPDAEPAFRKEFLAKRLGKPQATPNKRKTGTHD